LKDLKDKDCSDDYLNVIIDDVNASLTDSYSVTILILLCIHFLMDPTFTYIFYKCCGCKGNRMSSNPAVNPQTNDQNSVTHEKIIPYDIYAAKDKI
jgi:hypothetical protein